MGQLKGLYIEDEIDNITVISAMFELQNMELDYIETLPQNLEEYYDIILKKEIDFLIIDNHLEKQVSYKGIDVLKEIRRHDSTIYAVLLTNLPLEQFKDQFGEYDYEINKSQLRPRIEEIVAKIKRACSLRSENEVYESMEHTHNKELDTIKLLKEISAKLDEKN